MAVIVFISIANKRVGLVSEVVVLTFKTFMRFVVVREERV